MGLVRPHRRRHPDARRVLGQDHARRHRRQDTVRLHLGVAGQFHLFCRQQEEGWPRRRPVQSARDHLHPERPLEDVQGGGQRDDRQFGLPDGARRARQRPLHPDAQRGARQRPGVHRLRRRLSQQQPVQRQRSAADRLQRRRQLVPRETRGAVRRLGPPLHGRPDRPLRRRLPRHPARSRWDDARDSDPPVPPGQPRALHLALRRRHPDARSPDAERFGPVRPRDQFG